MKSIATTIIQSRKTSEVTELKRDLLEVKSIAEHAESVAMATDQALEDSFAKEIPSVFFIWPVDPGCGLKKLRSEIKSIVLKSVDCFCLC